VLSNCCYKFFELNVNYQLGKLKYSSKFLVLILNDHCYADDFGFSHVCFFSNQLAQAESYHRRFMMSIIKHDMTKSQEDIGSHLYRKVLQRDQSQRRWRQSRVFLSNAISLSLRPCYLPTDQY
jgi:hypothetical protein